MFSQIQKIYIIGTKLGQHLDKTIRDELWTNSELQLRTTLGQTIRDFVPNSKTPLGVILRMVSFVIALVLKLRKRYFLV